LLGMGIVLCASVRTLWTRAPERIRPARARRAQARLRYPTAARSALSGNIPSHW